MLALTVTSAMKGLYPATYDTLTDVIINGNWDVLTRARSPLWPWCPAMIPELNYASRSPWVRALSGLTGFTQDDYKAMKDMFDLARSLFQRCEQGPLLLPP